MKKMLQLLFVCVSVLLISVGCSNDSVEDDIEDNSELPTEESTDNEDDLTSESPSSEDLLGLGDTGILETEIGNFEVTPTAFRFEEEVGEDDEIPNNEIFIIVNLTIKNIDDEPIVSEDLIYSSNLENVEGAGVGADLYFDEINNFEGEIAPDETMTGELLFDFVREEAYEFSFGADYLDSLSNEVRWVFDADEVE
ncbi:DUF4352 domain-containing protein [Amphibacillus sp. Q70]|uniref:DUF4352 domain-containing protein n=1 Tax=Amphibacillus sp. Q70 TaxID=3453416 RepID=UPI003F87BE00